jgi:hypothetical protein
MATAFFACHLGPGRLAQDRTPHTNGRRRARAGADDWDTGSRFAARISEQTLVDFLPDVTETSRKSRALASVLPYPLPEGIVAKRCNSDLAGVDIFLDFFWISRSPGDLRGSGVAQAHAAIEHVAKPFAP